MVPIGGLMDSHCVVQQHRLICACLSKGVQAREAAATAAVLASTEGACALTALQCLQQQYRVGHHACDPTECSAHSTLKAHVAVGADPLSLGGFAVCLCVVYQALNLVRSLLG